MTALSVIHDDVVKELSARYAPWKVMAHGGSFGERELPLLMEQAPALLVSCSGIEDLRPRGASRWDATLSWVLFVLASDQGGVGRASVALDVVVDLLEWLPTQKWGNDHARLPIIDTLQADNLYTGHINLLQVAMWGLRWKQIFTITTP